MNLEGLLRGKDPLGTGERAGRNDTLEGVQAQYIYMCGSHQVIMSRCVS